MKELERKGTRPVRYKGEEDELLRLRQKFARLEASREWWKKNGAVLAATAEDIRRERDEARDELDAIFALIGIESDYIGGEDGMSKEPQPVLSAVKRTLWGMYALMAERDTLRKQLHRGGDQ